MFTLADEKKLYHEIAEWLLTVRHPGTKDLATVYQKAVELAEAGYPISKALVERAYRTCLSAGTVDLVTTKLAVPESVHARTLSVEEYRATPAAEIAKNYMRGGWYRDAVDKLIAEKKI